WPSPEWENPEWENPEWENPEWENPEWENPEWENPEWENPEWENPEWENTSLSGGDVANDSVKDLRFEVNGKNNTASAQNAASAITGLTGDLKFQLVGYQLYVTPALSGCKPKLVGNTQVLFNLTDRLQFNDLATSKASFWTDPGRRFYLNLRVWGTPDK